MQPARPAIERNGESRAVGDASSSDLACGFQHQHLAIGGLDSPRGGNAGGTCADHDNIRIARRRRAEGLRAESGRDHHGGRR